MNEGSNGDVVRESMRPFPRPLQGVLTWLTGVPLHGQQPRWQRSPLWHLMTGLGSLWGGVAASSLVILYTPVGMWPLLVVSWLFTVSGARKLFVMIVHHCVHRNFSGHAAVDAGVAEGLSTMLHLQGDAGYRHDHVVVHHSRSLATLEDPDLRFILQCGFAPGMDQRALWRQLLRAVVSPRVHRAFLRARLRANFVTAPWARRWLAIAYSAVLISVVAVTQSWLLFMLAWVVPLGPLYHVSAILQLLSEHRWLCPQEPTDARKLVLARLTTGRFSGEKAPAWGVHSLRDLVAWSRWVLRMLVVHLPARLFVLVGDLPQHDYHHRHARDNDWCHAAYGRQRDLEAGCPGWPEPYTACWGLREAIAANFALFSALPPLSASPQPLSARELEEVLQAL